MTDYGHDLQFGVFLPPAAADAAEVLALADLAEARGLDLVTVQDHPYQGAFLDAWTLLAAIAGRTSRVSVAPNVANLPLRPPAVLARSAASLDLLSGGRVELGLGAGAFWDAIEAMGGPRRTAGESVEALEEAVTIIRAIWSGERTPHLEGRHYRLAGAKPGPVPAHPIGIWLGAYGPRMLRLTGRVADGWLPSEGYAGPEKLDAMNAIVDESAQAAGRSPAAVRRLYNIDNRTEPSADWAERIAGLALDHGIGTFIVTTAVGGERALSRFAEEVAPAVRELVAAARGVLPPGGGAPVRRVGSGHFTADDPSDGSTGVAGAVTPAVVDPEWDESTRPLGPGGDHPAYGDGVALIEIHDHLRSELSQIKDLIAQVAAGSLDIASARSAVNQMTMRQNAWSVGAYCESYCRVVTIHHTIEDQSVFPRLRRTDERLGPVLDRLQAEHLVIHEALEAVDRGLVAMIGDPATIGELQRSVEVLEKRLTSHLTYEEDQLVGPLNAHGMH